MIGGLLKKILGDKSVKDRKTFQPIIDKVNEIYSSIQNISDDELRARTKAFQDKIKEGTAEIEKEIQDLEEQANHPDTVVLDKENIFEKIDKLTADVDEKIESILKELLPEAFATIKETARRWAENKQLAVTATEYDHKMAKTHDGLVIEGDKAIW